MTSTVEDFKAAAQQAAADGIGWRVGYLALDRARVADVFDVGDTRESLEWSAEERAFRQACHDADSLGDNGLLSALDTINMTVASRVLCNFCDGEWINDPTSGGLLVDTRVACPTCADQVLEDLEDAGELEKVKGTCPVDKPFGRWVIEDLGGGI